MMRDTRSTRHDGDLLEAYLDGDLQGEQRQHFETRIKSDAALREQIELQERIDSALGRIFADPAPDAAPASMPRRRLIHPALLALAAVVVLASAAVWLFVAGIFQERPDRLGPLYHSIVAAGFEPEIVCTTPEEFATWVRGNYGQALVPREDPGIQYIGWSYANIVSAYTGILLARVDGEPVIVAMDRLERELMRPGRPADQSLSMHRRRIGELVLYEITPHGRARVLPVLSTAE